MTMVAVRLQLPREERQPDDEYDSANFDEMPRMDDKILYKKKFYIVRRVVWLESNRPNNYCATLILALDSDT